MLGDTYMFLMKIDLTNDPRSLEKINSRKPVVVQSQIPKVQFIFLCITEFNWIEYAGHLYFYGGNKAKFKRKDAKVKKKYFVQ